jgi:hypothetical protein
MSNPVRIEIAYERVRRLGWCVRLRRPGGRGLVEPVDPAAWLLERLELLSEPATEER